MQAEDYQNHPISYQNAPSKTAPRVRGYLSLRLPSPYSRLHFSRPKLIGVKKKLDRREATRERKALSAAHIERSIEKELIERLKSKSYGDAPLNVNETVWQAILDREKKAASGKDADELELEDDETDEEFEEDLEEEMEEFGDHEFVSDFSDESDEEGEDDSEEEGSEEEDSDEETPDEDSEEEESKLGKRKKGPAPKAPPKKRKVEKKRSTWCFILFAFSHMLTSYFTNYRRASCRGRVRGRDRTRPATQKFSPRRLVVPPSLCSPDYHTHGFLSTWLDVVRGHANPFL